MRQEFIEAIMENYYKMPDDTIWEGNIVMPADTKYASYFFRRFAEFYLERHVPDDMPEIGSVEWDSESNEWKSLVWENFCTNETLVSEFMTITGLEMPEWDE